VQQRTLILRTFGVRNISDSKVRGWIRYGGSIDRPPVRTVSPCPNDPYRIVSVSPYLRGEDDRRTSGRLFMNASASLFVGGIFAFSWGQPVWHRLVAKLLIRADIFLVLTETVAVGLRQGYMTTAAAQICVARGCEDASATWVAVLVLPTP
jgi:hypothetical protein